MDIPWNVPWSHGIVGWDRQEDTRASVRGTGGHPMECPMISWDRGMGWTGGYTRICERDRWTSHGMSHDLMGSWDGMDSGTHASVRGSGGHPMECPTIPWDRGMG